MCMGWRGPIFVHPGHWSNFTQGNCDGENRDTLTFRDPQMILLYDVLYLVLYACIMIVILISNDHNHYTNYCNTDNEKNNTNNHSQLTLYIYIYIYIYNIHIQYPYTISIIYIIQMDRFPQNLSLMASPSTPFPVVGLLPMARRPVLEPVPMWSRCCTSWRRPWPTWDCGGYGETVIIVIYGYGMLRDKNNHIIIIVSS